MRLLGLIVALVCAFPVIVEAGDCAGTTQSVGCSGARWTPVRNVITNMRSRIAHRQAVADARRASLCAPAPTSCNGAGLGATVPTAINDIPAPSAAPVTPVSFARPIDSPTSIAQQKAQIQASQGVMRHIGGSFGGGSREGVGFSTLSPQDAIKNCCYYGKCQPIDIGVARGRDGWYATVLYR